MSSVALREFDPQFDPPELLTHSRVYHDHDPSDPRYYVPWITDECDMDPRKGTIYGGIENPLLRGGIAMATFSMEYMMYGNRGKS